MSITGSFLAYENNNHINKLKTRSSNIYSTNSTGSHLINTAQSMGKTGLPSSNPINSTNDSSVSYKQHQPYLHFKSPHLPDNYMNSKRKRGNFNSTYGQMYPDHNNYLHLNSLWSIWYGVLLTLFQGYLAVHGALRFLGCSLLSWKIEPVAELNLQIILSGLVFVLLPFFFTSAVFKVGNMANDGIKLGSTSKERVCSMVPHDGLEEEARGGTLRTLWTHGGPTAAFIHILIAMCLLLPRLLLEGRIIESGLLPKETIWRTELDFMSVDRRNLVVLSFKSSPYQNSTSIELQDDGNYFNETNFNDHSNNFETTNFLEEKKDFVITSNEQIKYFELSDLVGDSIIKANINNSNIDARKYSSTVSPISTRIFIYNESTSSKTNAAFKPTPEINNKTRNMDEGVGGTLNSNFGFTKQSSELARKVSELVSIPSLAPKNISYIIYPDNRQHNEKNNRNVKTIRKHHRQRKIMSPLAQRKKNQQHSASQKLLKSSSRRLQDFHQLNNESSELINLDKHNITFSSEVFNEGKVYEHRPTSYELLDYGHARVAIYPKSSTASSSTVRDSNIHIVKPEKLPEVIPSAPLSSNSKIFEINQKRNKKNKREIFPNEANHVEIEPEYLVGEFSFNDSSEINLMESSTTAGIKTSFSKYNTIRLDGFAGMLQLFFGIEKPIDVKAFTNPPSAEFFNLVFALFVWCVRYPAVFWTTAKSFATIFSVQMIASSADIIFSFVGVSSLFKLQIYSQEQPIKNSGLVLNASVTLALYLLSVILILSSSMVLYLYGHGRLSAKVRDRSIISLNSNESWTCFSHCASLCYVLALCVVKAPLLNDLNATYRNNLHCPTFMAALVSVMHILLWIIIWMGLAVKRKWSFKLPPLDAYTMIGKATTQPLLMKNKGSVGNTTTTEPTNLARMTISSSTANENTTNKLNHGICENLISNASNSDVLNDAPTDDIYWPKITSSSPKLKVTFNEVTSTSDDDHHHRLIGEHEQNDGKRGSPTGTSVYFTSIEGEIDDGDYATLRSGTTTIVGKRSEGSSEMESSVNLSQIHTLAVGVKVLHLSEIAELPPPPPNMTSSMTITNQSTTVSVNPQNSLNNCFSKVFGDDNISEEGKLLESVRDDSVTYASTRDLEPPLPPPPPKLTTSINSNSSSILHTKKITECIQMSSPDFLITPLAPVRVAVHTNESHIASSSTPRSLRRADSGVPQEDLTPKSDTNSCGTESTISPPERAPSETSSGIHSAEERDIEMVIRSRIASKPISKLPPAIQEEPNVRCMNMRMSSFSMGCSTNSATLPLQRSNGDQKFDYSLHCSTMPLPMNGQNHTEQLTQYSAYATSSHCMSKTPTTGRSMSSFKTPVYANSVVAMSGLKQNKIHDQDIQMRSSILNPQQVTHTTLSNGTRYSNPNILRRHPFIKASDSQYGHQQFSKNSFESSLVNSTILEDRDSANYSMISDQESLYAAANSLH